MEARIPFGGFYGSKWSTGVDDAEEFDVGYLAETHDVPTQVIHEWLWEHAKYRKAYEHIAREYVEPFCSFINDALDLSISLRYKDMSSPREYNFETDKIFVEISYRDALRLARRVGRNALRKAAKKMFTSYDGFISFYSNDVSTWGPLRSWDHNQLYCLFYAAGYVIDDDNWDWGIYEAMSENGDFITAFSLAYEHDDLLLHIGKWIGEKELRDEIEADEFQNSDGKIFPSHNSFTNTDSYVRLYHQLNSKGT